MTVVALALAAALAVVCVLVVARPFLRARRTPEESLGTLSQVDAERLRLLEERDRLLAALQDLEFDRESGKVAGKDYHTSRAVLRRDVAAVLVRLGEAHAGSPGPGDPSSTE